ncbi:oxygenase MpaB family protein [Sphingobacterium sp. SYP-B4668]|uniref:oxygenase MpaB family protein n=1 Tax=Sphingobacterium sp. SYP-B4668 TaxID=2996035 RepID=UPI0022DE2345|nr:oxygenase MpaB family protein [Sphingobacterium sp. SYP-B4668]
MIPPLRYRLNTSSFAHYWSQGIGATLLKKLPHTPDLAQADQFIPLLLQGDDVGDALIKGLHQIVGFKQGNILTFQYLKDPSTVAAPHRQLLDQFFSSFETKPDWIDKQKLDIGAQLSRRPGISALIVLRDYCLMGGYESSAINKPLIYTGALKKGAVKRLTDTVDFWVNITREGAFQSEGEGFKNVITTRLIHAYARVNILQSTDWESHKWGLPINTWDLLATNLGFSLVFIVGLRRMGIRPSEAEIEGLFHLWKYIGYLIGIPIELLPNNEQEAIESLYYWTMTQADGDNDSKYLAKALMEEPYLASYPPHRIGRLLMKEIHLYYNQYLLGNYSCNLLGLRDTLIGKVAYANILKNKSDEKKIHQPYQRELLIKKGGDAQAKVKAIYLKYNNH